MNKLAVLLALSAAAGLAGAVAPVETVHDSEADFAAGECRSVAVSNLGEVSVGGALEVLMPATKASAYVSAVALIGADIYAADGLSGQLFRVVGGKGELFAKVPGTIVTTLAVRAGKLLAGTGGEGAGIYSVDPKTRKVETLWADPKVKYVWAILPAADNALFAATGPEGKVFLVNAAGKADLVYQAGELADNIRCLAIDKGKLYAGTDKNGLVVLIDPAARTGRVLLDAGEPEITSLAVGADGEIYAATAAGAGPAAPAPVKAPSASGPARATTRGPVTPHSTSASRPASTSASAPAASASAPATMAIRPAAPSGPAPAPSAPPAGDGTGDVVSQDPALAKDAAAGTTPAPAIAGPGNAVYCINPDGLVRVITRRPVNFLSLVYINGQLIVGTGNEGKVFAVWPRADRSAMLADLDAKRVTALLVRPDGSLLLATANGGAVCSLARTPAAKGTFTSKTIEAPQVARWGTLQIDADLPAKSRLTVSARTGNLQTPDDKAWTPWTPAAAPAGRFIKIPLTPGRFMQYRLELTPSPAGDSPVVHSVAAVSQVGNLPPVIVAGMVAPSASPDDSDRDAVRAAGRKIFRIVRVQAGDPNGDTLGFRFDYRAVGSSAWIELTPEKDSPAPMFAWNTLTVADGAYEIRVRANDKASNMPEQAMQAEYSALRTTVDHTPPALAPLAVKVEAGVVSVSGSAKDALSRLASIYYCVDSQEPWMPVLPADGICDEPAEDFSFTVKDLPAGVHQVTVRVRDAVGNVSYQSVPVTVEKK